MGAANSEQNKVCPDLNLSVARGEVPRQVEYLREQLDVKIENRRHDVEKDASRWIIGFTHPPRGV